MSERAKNQEFDIDAFLKEQKAIIDNALDRFLPESDLYPSIVHEAMRYSVFGGGKRIRSILALAVSEAVEGNFSKTIYLAAALEFIHTYSLIHDDLPAMDNDDYRRGQLTCHKKFGEGIAILAGNGLMTRAFQILTEIPEDEDSAPVRVEVINRLCRAIGTEGGVIAGQVVDLTTQGKPFSEEELLYIHGAKTGALIEASISCSAILSRAPEQAQHALHEFGSKIGLAFQIVDDILDVVASSEQLGKTSGKDSREKKATYPALFGIEESRRKATELVSQAVGAIDCLGARKTPLAELAKFISIRRF